MENSGLNSQEPGPYLLIGSNVRFLAENAVKHGHNVVTVDYYGDWDTRRLAPNRSILRDGDGVMSMLSLLRLAGGVQNSGVIYGPGFENDIVALRGLQRLGRVLGCELKAARNSRNPESLIRAASTWGFKYPETLLEKRRPTSEGKWLVKPLASLGGGGVHLLGSQPGEPEGPYMLQKFAEGIPSSVAVVSNGSDAAILGIMTQIVGDAAFGASAFRFVGNVYPHPFYVEIQEKATEIAEALTLEFDLKGLWGFDFIYDGGVILLEVNPRPTAGMGLLGACAQSDLLGLHLDTFLRNMSDKIIDFAPARRYTGHARVFAEADGIFIGTEEWSQMGAKDIPDNGSVIRAGSPILTVTASAPSYSGVMAGLKAKAAKLRLAMETRKVPAL